MKKNFSFIESFRCAFRGIVYIFKTERNFKFHVMFSLLVLLCSLIFNLSYIELSIILIMIVIVLVLEIINTIIENIMDFLCKDYNLNIKIILLKISNILKCSLVYQRQFYASRDKRLCQQ